MYRGDIQIVSDDPDGRGVVNDYSDPDAPGGFFAKNIALLTSNQMAVKPSSNTGLQHLTGTVDLRSGGSNTGRLAVRFRMQLPNVPALTSGAGAGGFVVFQLGSGGPGTLTVTVLPVEGGGPANMVTAAITGDVDRRVTSRPHKTGFMLPVFIEYNGSDLTLVCGDSADAYHATTELPLASTPAPIIFGADATGMAFDDLVIYNTTLSASIYDAPTQFPYFLWDAPESGVIAVLPVTATPGEVVTFIDRGYRAGHQPASLDLSNASALTSPTLYVNEQRVPLSAPAGQTAAQFVDWLATTNGGVVTFPFDGKQEKIRFTKTGAATVTATHLKGATEGRLSFAVRFEGGSDADWGRTVAILGKTPQQFYLPYTGKLNEGVSLLGTNKTVTTPRGLKVSRRDDKVRTVGRIIGSVHNRPTSKSMLQMLDPVPFFGCKQAPYPAKCQVWGNPNELSSALPESSAYAYGIAYAKFLTVDPPEVNMQLAPNNRSRIGDHFAGFSIDIPYGKVLRGIDINFSGMPPGLEGNAPGRDGFNSYDWGLGQLRFPMVLSGGSDYTCVFMLMVATDSQGTRWRPVPSIGTDAVKVSGSNTWKTVGFKSIDFQTLLDDEGKPLLMGSRRTHFKLVLAAELTAVTFGGLSYKIDKSPKK